MSTSVPPRAVLVIDLGGTNARIACCVESPVGPMIVDERWYPSAEASGLEPLLRRWMAEVPEGAGGLAAAGVAVAGPVDGETAVVSNLGWTVSADALRACLGLSRVALLNDFAAVALGAADVPAARRVSLQAGRARPDAPRAIIGAGTGLGQALVVPGSQGQPDRVLPTEGGHADFAPQSAAQDALLVWLRGRYGEHVSVERVVSGQGLADTLRWAAERSPARVTEATRSALDSGGDLAAHVTARAATDPVCAEVLDLFLFCYGAEAGNLALKSLPFGGLFVAGGIAPRLTECLLDTNGPFLRGLRTKGRFSGLLESIPVTLLLDPRVGLLGAARAARALCVAA